MKKLYLVLAIAGLTVASAQAQEISIDGQSFAINETASLASFQADPVNSNVNQVGVDAARDSYQQPLSTTAVLAGYKATVNDSFEGQAITDSQALFTVDATSAQLAYDTHTDDGSFVLTGSRNGSAIQFNQVVSSDGDARSPEGIGTFNSPTDFNGRFKFEHQDDPSEGYHEHNGSYVNN